MARPGMPRQQSSVSDAQADDETAIKDVYRSVEETGSLEAAARKLQKYAATQGQQRSWEDDPEEAAYVQSGSAQDDAGDEDMEEIVHLQEVIPGLWIGDLVAAMDTPGLAERGITNILSALQPRLTFPNHLNVYPLEIDDAPDTDILTHLPSCVAWIKEALAKREADGDPKSGGVLVHCQAGMSRSATLVIAYLMKELDIDQVQALDMVRDKRPVVDPSDTFWFQLAVFYNADGRVSLKDRSTRQFYMERTTSAVMNGNGNAPPMDKMAKYPATPTESNPPTPLGGPSRRKIRCKMCRRHLAVREHMMDHILEQAPVSRPRTPSNFSLPSPRASFSNGSGFTSTSNFTERRPSVVSDIVNPLTGLPGATRSRQASVSSVTSPTEPTGAIPGPRRSGSLSGLTAVHPSTTQASGPVASPDSISRPDSAISTQSTPASRGRPLRSADELTSHLPPHLLALRTSGGGSSALSSPFNLSPTGSPETEVPNPIKDSSPAPNSHVRSLSTGSTSSIPRKMSLLAMTPADGPGRDTDSKPNEQTSVPILVNPKCSGYFVEPLTWMEPFLKNGEISGKILCPNEKCKAKIGNYDWAGVQCGCKEWVTPGFCISRSKVDEVW